MANEELTQRNYLSGGRLKGDKFGVYEEFNLGATSVKELKAVGLHFLIPETIDFPFTTYKPPKKPESCKPDRVFASRISGSIITPVAVAEYKAPSQLLNTKQQLRAAEQSLYAAASLGAKLGVTSNGVASRYIDVEQSLEDKQLVFYCETRDFTPAVLAGLLAGDAGIAKDPAPLAESVWQVIWHATKEEPKQCLLTFVEIFMLKFLSDNLPVSVLPNSCRFYELSADPKAFYEKHGTTAIEYYVETIRPRLKTLFPDNTIAKDPVVAELFGLNTVVSKTSVVNGFAFLRSSSESLGNFNRVFLEILSEFEKFGPLTSIDPEFKLRLYETFLRRSARQQKLGQFFTPRNVVRQMVRMAQLEALNDGSVVLDPAAGVGGFILEPSLLVDTLKDNVKFSVGQANRKIKLIGVDVDVNTHILAKANTLLHYAEAVRNPSTTIGALNQLMAETFVLMNDNETLGALQNPPRGNVDVILTNPPYVTRGSGVYKEEVRESGVNDSGLDLRDYYRGVGLGVEALFLRYISGALKPGGRAFVIVPLGMLNRTEPGPKRKILDECNLIASIALPRNTFFNTSQLTYVIGLERRHSVADPRPKVFCGIARSIGESLNWERVPNPNENDLADISDMFIAFDNGDATLTEGSLIAKVIDADKFTENDRWDVARFWSEDELVKLGQKESAVSRADLIDEIRAELDEISSELDAAKRELSDLTSGDMATYSLSDPSLFSVRSGSRVTGSDIRENPGDLKIFSCFKTEVEVKGFVDRNFFVKERRGRVETKPLVTVNANGASVGHVYVRREECGLTDDVIGIEVLDAGIDVDYLAVALSESVNKGGFLYEAKLFVRRVLELEVEIPVKEDGSFDLEQQKAIASAVRRFDAIRTKMHDLGTRSRSARAV